MSYNSQAERLYTPPEPQPAHRFFSGYAGQGASGEYNPLQDEALQKALDILRNGPTTKREQLTIAIDPRLCPPGVVGMLVRDWSGENREQEIVYYDEDGQELKFSVLDDADKDKRLKIRSTIRTLTQDHKPVAKLTSYYIYNSENPAVAHTNPDQVAFPYPVISAPEMTIIGETREEMEQNLEDISQMLEVYGERYLRSPKSEFIPRVITKYVESETPVIADGISHPLFDQAVKFPVPQKVVALAAD